MNHIRKYKIFENQQNDDVGSLYKYCEDVFAELIDENKCEIDIHENEIYVYILNIDYNNIENFNKYLDIYRNHMELIEDVNVSLKRLRDVFNVDIKFEIDESLILIITLSSDVSDGIFYTYNKKTNRIKFNDIELIKMLGIPNIKIGLSTNGNQYFISFIFSKKESLEEFQDILISKVQKLKIEGEFLNQPGSYGYSTSTGDIIKTHEIKKDYLQRYGSSRGEGGSKRINEITFSLNKKFEY
jgi:hypothetical protein